MVSANAGPLSSAAMLTRFARLLRNNEQGGRSFLGAAARFIATGVLSVATDVGVLAILQIGRAHV